MGLATIQNRYLDGNAGLTCAEATAARIDGEVQSIMNQCYQEAIQILQDNREMLDAIAQYLLKKETITGQEMMAILNGEDPDLVDNFGIGPNATSAAEDPTIERPALHVSMESGLPSPAQDNTSDEEKPEQPDESEPE
jgi:cell division protease FtsH